MAASYALKLPPVEEAHGLGKGESHARVNSLRPARRRRLMILQPLAVAILLRKPFTDLRRRLLGWYVRFTMHPLFFQRLKSDEILRQIVLKKQGNNCENSACG